MSELWKNFTLKQKLVAMLILLILFTACDDSSGDNPKLEDWQNNPVGAVEESYNQAWDDSNLDQASCEAANLLVGDMTKQDYCK